MTCGKIRLVPIAPGHINGKCELICAPAVGFEMRSRISPMVTNQLKIQKSTNPSTFGIEFSVY